MSGDRREQLRAVFLAFVMITSIMVASVAFTGSAAAAPGDENLSTSPLTGDASTVETHSLKWPIHPNATQTNAGGLAETNFTVRVDNIQTSTSYDLFLKVPEGSGYTFGNTGTVTSNRTLAGGPTISTVNNTVLKVQFSEDGSQITDNNAEIQVKNIPLSGTPSSEGDTTVSTNLTLRSTPGDQRAKATLGTLTADGTTPSFNDVRKTGTKEVTVKLSEDVYADEDQLGAIDSSNGVSYIDGNSGGATGISSVSYQIGSNSFKITTDNAISSDDIGTDAIFAPGIFDDAGQQLTTDSQTIASSSLAGQDDGEVATEIENDAGTADHSQNISAGSATQTLNLITVKDVSPDGNQLGTRTLVSMPDGVTINKTASNNNNFIISGYDINNFEIVNQNTLRIEHQSSSSSGDEINIKGLVVDTAADVSASQGGDRLDINVDYALGSLDSGLVTVHKPSLLTGVNNRGAATAQQQLKPIQLRTQAASGQIGEEIVIFANQSNGITFDQSIDPTDASLYQDNTLVDHQNATINSTVFTVPVNSSNSIGGGSNFNLSTPGGTQLQVNITGDASGSFITAAVRANDSTGAVSAEIAGTQEDINVLRPELFVSNANSPVTIGRDGSSFAGSNRGPIFQVVPAANNQFGDGTNVTITINNSDVTFDRRTDPSANIVNNAGGNNEPPVSLGPDISDDGASITLTLGSGTFETDGNSIAENTTDDVLQVGTGTDDIGLNTTDDVVPSDIQFNLTTTPGTTRADVKSANSTQPVTVQNPTGNVNGGTNFTVFTGDTGNQSIDLSGTGSSNEISFTENSNNSDLKGIGTDGDVNVTISLERGTGITFSQANSDYGPINSPTFNSQSNLGIDTSSQAEADDGNLNNGEISLIDSQSINITLGQADDSQSESFNLDNVTLNATASATNTSVFFEVNTTDVNITGNKIVVASENKTTARYNSGSDQVLSLDDNARDESVALTGSDGTPQKLSTVFGVSDDIPTDFNITYTVPSDTGVTFDQSQTMGAGQVTQNGIGGTVTTAQVVDGQTLNVSIDGAGGADGDSVRVASVEFNATEDASNTTLQFSLNSTSSTINNKSVTGQLNFTEVAPTDVAPDANVDDTTGDATPSVVVNEETRTAVKVTSSEQSHGDFSGADVNLASNDTSIGSTNVSQVTTYENGLAVFNVTGGSTAGEQFNVTATVASNNSLSTNLTVDTASAGADQIRLVRLQNGVVQNNDGSLQSTEMAAVTLRVEDSDGNLVSNNAPSIDIDSLGVNTSANITGFSNDLGGNGVLDMSDIGTQQTVAGQTIDTSNGDGGKVYIGLSRTSGTQDVLVSATTPNLGSNDGTTTVFSEPNSVSVQLANKSTPLTANQNVNVSYTASDNNGDVIEVQGLSFSASSTNNSVVSSSDGTATTTTSGTAFETFSSVQPGSATIQGTESRTNIFSDTDVTVQGAQLSLTLNTSQVTATEASGVNANVTFAGNSTPADATVDVTGQNIDNRTGLTTGTDGEVNFTVNASSTGDITVTANRGDAASDSATIVVEQQQQEEPPTASVTFNDQSVQNGSTTVTVASATFNGSEAFNIVVHQATDTDDDGTIQASEIGKKIGESVELDNGTQTDIPVNISKQVADNDNVSQLTENQTLVAMLHTTNTSDDDNIVHTASIKRDGTPVFDQAEITIEEDARTGEELAREFAGEDGELGVLDVFEVIDAFQNDEVEDPLAVFRVIEIFREGGLDSLST